MPVNTSSASNSIRLIIQTIAAVFAALRQNKLSALIPVTIVMLLAAVGLFFINFVSPIAPFVYSLF